MLAAKARCGKPNSFPVPSSRNRSPVMMRRTDSSGAAHERGRMLKLMPGLLSWRTMDRRLQTCAPTFAAGELCHVPEPAERPGMQREGRRPPREGNRAPGEAEGTPGEAKGTPAET